MLSHKPQESDPVLQKWIEEVDALVASMESPLLSKDELLIVIAKSPSLQKGFVANANKQNYTVGGLLDAQLPYCRGTINSTLFSLKTNIRKYYRHFLDVNLKEFNIEPLTLWNKEGGGGFLPTRQLLLLQYALCCKGFSLKIPDKIILQNKQFQTVEEYFDFLSSIISQKKELGIIGNRDLNLLLARPPANLDISKNPYLTMPIEEMLVFYKGPDSHRLRVASIFRQKGIRTVADLVQSNAHEVLSFRGFCTRTYLNIARLLASYGLAIVGKLEQVEKLSISSMSEETPRASRKRLSKELTAITELNQQELGQDGERSKPQVPKIDFLYQTLEGFVSPDMIQRLKSEGVCFVGDLILLLTARNTDRLKYLWGFNNEKLLHDLDFFRDQCLTTLGEEKFNLLKKDRRELVKFAETRTH